MKGKTALLAVVFTASIGALLTTAKDCSAEKENYSKQTVKLHEVPSTPYPSHVSLSYLPPKERKKEFIKLMLPLIEKANEEVMKERKFLLSIKGKKKLTPLEEKKLKELKKKYKADSYEELLKRVNIVPVSLVLAQAAIESGWGTSRFFTEANNAFGIYSYSKKRKCLKAKKSGACLKVYPDLYESVKDYIYNINVSWAYKDFRDARSKGASLDTLIKELEKYSVMRKQYTELVKNVIKNNNLTDFDGYALSFTGSGSSR
ncbi:Bax protein [Desulfurobacterium pacificum]|uniref:Bax protein n=1 Tax=Desulfurobacterium pacificum TaxID=240166 RepID=A0ABY1NRS0_9BACT|nr:glucosaminidase domain-containing protein [Desulfurobacterium pacificum]SMP16535.1 Bax protein [Desulfurobacterium pacificum]